jgi:hypothetical protein
MARPVTTQDQQSRPRPNPTRRHTGSERDLGTCLAGTSVVWQPQRSPEPAMPAADPTPLVQFCAALARARGLDHQGLANLVGCSRPAVSRWLEGKRQPRPKWRARLELVAEFLDHQGQDGAA